MSGTYHHGNRGNAGGRHGAKDLRAHRKTRRQKARPEIEPEPIDKIAKRLGVPIHRTGPQPGQRRKKGKR